MIFLGFTGRSLLQAVNDTESIRQSDDTVRVDPLDHFKKYRGGYDITNKHYWSSTAFTGIYGYAPGVLWLFCGFVYGVFLLATSFCFKNRNREPKKRSACHKHCYLRLVLLASLFTVLALAATGVVLGGQVKFHSRAKTVVDIIINTANEASETIYNTTGAMTELSSNLEASNGSSQTITFLTSTSQKLDSKAADVQRQAKKNRNSIDRGLKIVYIITTVILSFSLVAVIALSATGILGMRRSLYAFIVICWLLTVLCWLFFGLYFFLEKFEGDTCTAIEEFQQYPYNSSLSSILPCNELRSAKSVLADVSAGIYKLVKEVNANISKSYSNIVQVCNPFSAPPDYQYQPDNCPPNSIKIGQIPQALKPLACSEDNGITCKGGLLTSQQFKQVEAYTVSIQNLLNAYPGMQNLADCQLVEDALSEILHRYCKPLKRNTQMVWAPLVFLSIIMVGLVLTWTAEAHHQQEYQFSDSSMKPHSLTAEKLEAGAAKTTG
ncbi:hypothetical protein NMG60_11028211 [Bertholletia excelsa]